MYVCLCADTFIYVYTSPEARVQHWMSFFFYHVLPQFLRQDLSQNWELTIFQLGLLPGELVSPGYGGGYNTTMYGFHVGAQGLNP